MTEKQRTQQSNAIWLEIGRHLRARGLPAPPLTVRQCGVCGLPTITEYAETYCMICHQLVCATCRLGHDHNFGPPFGMRPIDS